MTLITLVLSALADGQLRLPSDQIDAFAKRAFSQCEDRKAYYSGLFSASPFSCQGLVNSEPSKDCVRIVEVQGMPDHPVSYEPYGTISATDFANKIDARGLLTLSYANYRTRYAIMAQPIGSRPATAFAFGNWTKFIQAPKKPTDIALLVHERGRWFILDQREAAWGSVGDINLGPLFTTPSLPIGADDASARGWIQLDTLLQRIKPRDCSEALLQDDPEPSERSAWVVKVPLSDRKFTGSAQAFVGALPGFVKRAAESGGQDGRRYDHEVEILQGVVNTCSQITPEYARSVTKYTAEFLGSQYQVCGGRKMASALKVGEKAAPRSILYSVQPIGRWKDGRGFTINIEFTGGLPGEPAVRDFNDIDKYYNIVTATIQLGSK